MALPVATALQGGLHVSSFPKATLPKAITLSGSATFGDGASITTWEWSLLRADPANAGGLPATSLLDTTTVGDFINGKSAIQNPSITLDAEGGYNFSLRVQNNIGQWSLPTFIGDGESSQAIVYILTDESVKLPPANMFRYEDNLNETLAANAGAGGGTLDRLLLLSDDSEFTEAGAVFATKKFIRMVSDSGKAIVSLRLVCSLWIVGGGTATVELEVVGSVGTFSDAATVSTEATETAVSIVTTDLVLNKTSSPNDTFATVNIKIKAATGVAHIKYTDLFALYA